MRVDYNEETDSFYHQKSSETHTCHIQYDVLKNCVQNVKKWQKVLNITKKQTNFFFEFTITFVEWQIWLKLSVYHKYPKNVLKKFWCPYVE